MASKPIMPGVISKHALPGRWLSFPELHALCRWEMVECAAGACQLSDASLPQGMTGPKLIILYQPCSDHPLNFMRCAGGRWWSVQQAHLSSAGLLYLRA